MIRKSRKYLFMAVTAVVCFYTLGAVLFVGFPMPGGGTSSAPPQLHEAQKELAESGVTEARPLFAIEREGDEEVSLSGRLSHDSVASGELEEIAAAIGVQAWQIGAQRDRAPIEIALVFDVSGSMRGAPLHDVKTAAHGLLDQLDERDRVALVSYNAHAWTVAELTRVDATNRSSLKEAVSGLEADGGTNIHAGWMRGKNALAEASTASTRRVVLLSDGHANEGITDIDRLASFTGVAMESGVVTTTLGVGLQYNEDLMQSMARRGGGNYYFVHDDTPSRALDTEFASLTGALSSRTLLRVTTAPPLKVEAVEGFQWKPIADGVEIELGALSEDMRRDVLIEFMATRHSTSTQLNAELIRFDTDARSHRHDWHTAISVSDKTNYNAEVLSRRQKIRTARALRVATSTYQSGDRDRAQELLKRTIETNDRFVTEHGVDADVFGRANASLERLAKSIRDYDPSSSRGKYLIKGYKSSSANIAVDSQVTF